MTGKPPEFENIPYVFEKSVFFLKNGDFVENIFGKKLIFFLAILTFFMAALDVQQNLMPTRYLFFIKSYSVFLSKSCQS